MAETAFERSLYPGDRAFLTLRTVLEMDMFLGETGLQHNCGALQQVTVIFRDGFY